MLYISKIGVKRDGVVGYPTHYSLEVVRGKDIKFDIQISDTASGDKTILRGRCEDIIEDLKELMPFGFVNADAGADKQNHYSYMDAVFVVNQWLLKLIDLVEDSQEIMIFDTDEAYPTIREFTGNFESVDPMNVFFLWQLKNTYNYLNVSLLDAMVFCPSCWYKGAFYAFRFADWYYPDKNNDNLRQKCVFAYKITFSNIKAVQRLVTKVAVAGYNPIRDFLNQKH